jgi:TonB family protein
MSTRIIGMSLGVVAALSLGGMTRGRTQSPTRDQSAHRAEPGSRLQQLERDIALFQQTATNEPTNASAQHVLGAAYFEMTRDATLDDAERRVCIERGIGAENRALAADPNFAPALVYKNLLLRLQSERERDPGTRDALIREADALRARAMQAAREGAFQQVPEGTVVTPGPPPPPPPPATNGLGREDMPWVYANTAYTALGVPPARTKDVRPIYAPMVMASGIQGEVVVEATVDTRGKVAMLRVVRTLPMLTQATIDAVRQWEFDPTTMSGAPVVVTVTASFTPPRYSRSASTGSTRVPLRAGR